MAGQHCPRTAAITNTSLHSSKGVEEGSFVEVNSELASRLIISTAMGLLLQSLLDPKGAKWEKVARDSTNMLVNSLLKSEALKIRVGHRRCRAHWKCPCAKTFEMKGKGPGVDSVRSNPFVRIVKVEGTIIIFHTAMVKELGNNE